MTGLFEDEQGRERARQLFAQMLPGQYPEASGDEFDLFDSIAGQVQWPTTWAGGDLDVKTRSLCTVASLITSGKPQVNDHIRAALAAGASRQEIADLITHIAFYAGFPSAGNAKRAAKQVFAELDAPEADLASAHSRDPPTNEQPAPGGV
jgi:4-carboxymuconolactone decarboxylase